MLCSRYERRLADATIGGRRGMIWLRVRRLFCDEPACKKRTFAEQVPGLTVRYARKTALLTEVLCLPERTGARARTRARSRAAGRASAGRA